jgi:hypothetical protein
MVQLVGIFVLHRWSFSINVGNNVIQHFYFSTGKLFEFIFRKKKFNTRTLHPE